MPRDGPLVRTRGTMLGRDAFYRQLVSIVRRSPLDRHILLSALHTEVLTHYLAVVRTISEQAAKRISSDGRTIGQMVAHIAEWERWTLVALGEIVAGVEWPQIMNLSGYVGPNGQTKDFASVDAFNAYQATTHATQPWAQIQNLTCDVATSLHLMFTQPQLVTPERLENTKTYKWHLPDGTELAMPAGWYLWMVSLEHEGVEHIADLESASNT